MAHTTIEIDHTTSAAPEAVWALLADIATWTAWGEWDAARLKREDPAGGPGVGAVRELRLQRTRSVERVTEFDLFRFSKQSVDKVVIHLPVNEDTLHRDADLHTVGKCAHAYPLCGEGDTGIRLDDHAGISAEPQSLLRVLLRPGETHLYPVTGPGEDVVLIKKETGDRAAFKDLNHGQNFLDCIRSRQDPISDVDATHVASYLGLLAEIAARLETRLKWDPVKEKFIGNREANRRLRRPLYNGWKL